MLKPGGIVVATTQSRSFIDLCEQMRTDPAYAGPGLPLVPAASPGRSSTRTSAYRRFDAGEFLHAANGGGDALAESLYGDSLFSGGTSPSAGVTCSTLVRFDDKPNDLPQACFVLRKSRMVCRAATSRELQAANARVTALEGELRAVRASRTWTGRRAVLAPAACGQERAPDKPWSGGLDRSTARCSRRSTERDLRAFVPREHTGYCPACDQETVFDIVQAWLRDGYLCRRCGSIPRERALAHVLRRAASRASPDLVIHESSPEWRGISRYLRDHCPGYVATYCRPGQPLGVDDRRLPQRGPGAPHASRTAPSTSTSARTCSSTCSTSTPPA